MVTTIPEYSTATTISEYSTATTIPDYSTATNIPEYSTATTKHNQSRVKEDGKLQHSDNPTTTEDSMQFNRAQPFKIKNG